MLRSNAGAGGGADASALHRLSVAGAAPDDTTINLFFGHSGVSCTREKQNIYTVADIPKKQLPSNVLIVTFGLIGDTNSFALQEILQNLSKTDNKNWLYDPITNFDNILEHVNTELLKETEEPVQMFLSMDTSVDFRGIPFSYADNLEEGNYVGFRRPIPGHEVYKSGLYSLNAVATDPRPFTILKDSHPAPVHPPEDVDGLFIKALLPTLDDLEKTNRDPKTLRDWYRQFFGDDLLITTDKLISIADGDTTKWHIFYLSACRSSMFTQNVARAAGITRSGEQSVYNAEYIARKTEESLSDGIRNYTNPSARAFRASIVAAEKVATRVARHIEKKKKEVEGGSRRKRKYKKRLTRRKRHL